MRRSNADSAASAAYWLLTVLGADDPSLFGENKMPRAIQDRSPTQCLPAEVTARNGSLPLWISVDEWVPSFVPKA